MNNQQLDFAFVAELPISTVVPKKRATRAKAAPVHAPGLAPTSSLLEQAPVAARAVMAPIAAVMPAMAAPDSSAVSIQLDVESMAAALQAQLGKLWNATGGKLMQQQQASEGDPAAQTCSQNPGTVGETIRTK